MPNPRGNLAGFTDREDPNWKERTMERVRERQKKTHRNYERKNGMYLFFDDPYRVYLDEAARRRDISMTGYGRRATAAFIGFDLGIPPEEVMMHAATPTGYGKTGVPKGGKSNDNGEGHGLWIIEGLITPDQPPL